MSTNATRNKLQGLKTQLKREAAAIKKLQMDHAKRIKSAKGDTRSALSKKFKNIIAQKRKSLRTIEANIKTLQSKKSDTRLDNQRNVSGSSRNKTRKNKSTGSKTTTSSTPAVRAFNALQTKTQLLYKELKTVWKIENVRPFSDDFIVESISKTRTNDLSYWPAQMIRQARTCASIGTKIKSSAPLQSFDDAIAEFIATQDEPVCSDRYAALTAKMINEIFQDFPYQKVKDEVESIDRDHVITNGSSYPPLLAPVISGVNGNIELIAAMAAGEDIKLSTFNVNEWITGIGDGRLTKVPKNYKKYRIITITSRDFIDKQYVINDYFRDWITNWSKTSNHITQFDDQSVQWTFLKEGYATLDLSSASDRIYRSFVEKVWPEFIQYFGEYLPSTVVTDKGRIIPLTCIGTQGFPLTFTVMAIITGAIVAAVKTSNLPSANYGDDIVCAEIDFSEVYCALEASGLQINKRKTFKSSQGFLESCGVDVMFTSNGTRNVTPIHLRGESDVEYVQFFYQLIGAELISVEDATSILDKLHVEYYAFEDSYQQTEFHLPFGEPKNLSRRIFSYDKSRYECNVPALKQEISQIKGLSKQESDTVLRLLHIEASLKRSNISELSVRKPDQTPRPYALMDLQDDRLYSLYQKLDVAGHQVDKIFYEELAKSYKTTFKALSYYKFITTELVHYRFSTATVDFSEIADEGLSIQEFIDSEYGIMSETKYPIYRYKITKATKTIQHPDSERILGTK